MGKTKPRGLFYVYARVFESVTQWFAIMLVMGAMGWLIDHQDLGLATFLGAGIGLIAGGWRFVHQMQKLHGDINDETS